MTNMTFTKGIGSPTYMAPEVLNKDKYKKAADVYSFAVMTFECFKWGDAYPKEMFRFPWDVVSFVSSGRRVEIPSDFPPQVKTVISRSWDKSPAERMGLSLLLSPPDMTAIVEHLQTQV